MKKILMVSTLLLLSFNLFAGQFQMLKLKDNVDCTQYTGAQECKCIITNAVVGCEKIFTAAYCTSPYFEQFLKNPQNYQQNVGECIQHIDPSVPPAQVKTVCEEMIAYYEQSC